MYCSSSQFYFFLISANTGILTSKMITFKVYLLAISFFVLFPTHFCSLTYFTSLSRTQEIYQNPCHLNVTPEHYEIHIDPEFLPEVIILGTELKSAKVSAWTKIRIRVKETCNETSEVGVITLNPRFLKDINLCDVQLTHIRTNKSLEISYQSLQIGRDICSSDTLYKIQFKEVSLIITGDELEINIPYKMELLRNYAENNWHGFYFFNAHEVDQSFYVNPLRTPFMFPAFDDENSSQKSNFTISVSRPEEPNYVVISNMGLEQTCNQSRKVGWVVDYFQESVPLKPSQVAVVLLYGYKNYTLYHTRSNASLPKNETTAVNIWASESTLQEHTKRCNLTGKYVLKMLAFFEEKFQNWEYSLDKLDLVAVNTKFGSNLKPTTLGIVMNYESNIILMEPTVEPPEALKFLRDEIAFQWIGGMITFPDDVLEYCGTNTISDRMLGLSKYVAGWADTQLPEYLRHWSTYFLSSGDIDKAWLEALEMIVSRDVMGLAVVNYFIPKMKWNTAHLSDLYDALQQALEMKNLTHLLPATLTASNSDFTIRGIFNGMANHSFYQPRINVNSIENQTSSIQVYQENIYAEEYGDLYSALWWIPVKFLTNSGTLQGWLPPNATTQIIFDNSSIIDTRKWLIVNPDGSRYCTVQYDKSLLKNIIHQLKTNHSEIPEIARKFLIHNQLEIIEKKMTPNLDWDNIEPDFQMTLYLDKEMSWLVWENVLKHLDEMIHKFKDRNVWEEVKKYFASLMNSVLARIGTTEGEEENEGLSLLRSVLMSHCATYEIPLCMEYALELKHEWMKTPDSDPFSSDKFSEKTTEQLYCASNSHAWTTNGDIGSGQVVHFIIGQLASLQNKSCVAEKGLQLVKTLTCTKSEVVLMELLNSTIVQNIPDNLKHDYRSNIPHEILMNFPFKLDEAIVEFYKEEFSNGNISPREYLEYLRDITWRLCTTTGLPEKVVKFLDDNKNLFTHDRNLENFFENIKRMYKTLPGKVNGCNADKQNTDNKMKSWFLLNIKQ